MIQRALEQRWPISDRHRQALVNRLMRIVLDPDSSERAAISAAKALMAAEKQNQDDEHKVVDIGLQYDDAKLASIAFEIGIDPRLISDVAREEAGDTASDSDTGQGES